MKISVITPNYNGELFLEKTVLSVLEQREQGVDLEYIVIDGQSDDSSIDIFNKYRSEIDTLIIEPDTGPANAINKGLARATGDIVAWLNADDIYYPGTLKKVTTIMSAQKEASFCFGKCKIINTKDEEIRRFITIFKETFFPISSKFMFQIINYISQPAMFFSREKCESVGYLREDMLAAWDYEFLLRLWRVGGGIAVPGMALSAFRWHETSISGQNFDDQFREELEVAAKDAGRYSLQTFLHHLVRWGIVGAYRSMAISRRLQQKRIDKHGQ